LAEKEEVEFENWNTFYCTIFLPQFITCRSLTFCVLK